MLAGVISASITIRKEYIMDRNIESYVKIYRNAVDEKFRKSTLKLLKDPDIWAKHSYHNELNNKDTTYDDDLDISKVSIQNHNDMMQNIYGWIGRYIGDLGLPFYNGWNGYSAVRYNRYNVGTNMKIHVDHINTVFDGTRRGIPVLTVLGLLNDDFEGGEFTLFHDPEWIVDLKKGDVIIFPSNFMYPHKVESVTKGIRYSFVSWVW
jgi:2OG-Fe(II) oxygenase superfamily